MSAMSDYLEDAFLDHFLGTSSTTAPSAVYIGLHTADPTDAGTGAEVSGNGYARQSMAFAASSSGTASNSAAVEFPAASGGNWGTITHIGIYDYAHRYLRCVQRWKPAVPRSIDGFQDNQ